jgi:DNA (cytosine-5)-methyltransferase 1
MEKKVIELFAGVGGFRVGLNNVQEIDDNGKAIEENDWKFVWASQWEPSTITQHAYDCYVTRFENPGPHSNDDISIVNKKELPSHSLLVGGFPCQDYSVARTKSNEKGIEGKKGVLFWQITEILEAKKTPFVLLENVDRLLKSPARQRGRDFGIMLRTFADLGYNLEWRIINAADYGCAQRRRRIFIFAWKKELKYNSKLNHDTLEDFQLKESVLAKSFPIDIHISSLNKSKSINLFEYEDTVSMTDKFSFLFENGGIMVDGIVKTRKLEPTIKKPITMKEIREENNDLSQYFLTQSQIAKFEYLKNGKKIDRIKPNGDPYVYSEGGMGFPDNLELPGRTMLTSEASINRSTHVIEDGKTGKLRFITPIEAERMQSFPDNWTNTGMPESRRYFMMGNALVTKVINRLEPELRKVIENEK